MKKSFQQILTTSRNTSSYWIGEAGDKDRKGFASYEEDIRKMVDALEKNRQNLLTIAGIMDTASAADATDATTLRIADARAHLFPIPSFPSPIRIVIYVYYIHFFPERSAGGIQKSLEGDCQLPCVLGSKRDSLVPTKLTAQEEAQEATVITQNVNPDDGSFF